MNNLPPTGTTSRPLRTLPPWQQYRLAEANLCRRDPAYFIDQFCQIYDASNAGAVGTSRWVPFRLWPIQRQSLQWIHENRLVVILKARQLGFSWLVLGLILWEMVFHPGATVLIFSKRDDEAVEL